MANMSASPLGFDPGHEAEERARQGHDAREGGESPALKGYAHADSEENSGGDDKKTGEGCLDELKKRFLHGSGHLPFGLPKDVGAKHVPGDRAPRDQLDGNAMPRGDGSRTRAPLGNHRRCHPEGACQGGLTASDFDSGEDRRLVHERTLASLTLATQDANRGRVAESLALLHMDEYAAELARALTASGIRQTKIAADLDVDASNVSQWKTGHRPVPADKAPALAAIVGTRPELISAAYAATADASARAPGRRVLVPAYEIEAVENDEDFDSDREVWVQGVDIEVSAGDGAVVPEFIDTQYRQRFTLQWLRRMGAKAEDLRVMRVRGDSMERTVFDGDKVVINMGDKKIVSNHVYVVVVGDEAKVKRLFRAADGRVRIVSDNPDKATYPDEYVELTSDRFLVIGRVIDKSGAGGL